MKLGIMRAFVCAVLAVLFVVGVHILHALITSL